MFEGTFIFLESSLKERGLEDVALRTEVSSSEHAFLLCSCSYSLSLFTGELLSQPRPEGLTEIICPKNGSERVNVALVYPPTPTVISPCSK